MDVPLHKYWGGDMSTLSHRDRRPCSASVCATSELLVAVDKLDIITHYISTVFVVKLM